MTPSPQCDMGAEDGYSPPPPPPLPPVTLPFLPPSPSLPPPSSPPSYLPMSLFPLRVYNPCKNYTHNCTFVCGLNMYTNLWRGTFYYLLAFLEGTILSVSLVPAGNVHVCTLGEGITTMDGMGRTCSGGNAIRKRLPNPFGVSSSILYWIWYM